LERFDYAQVGAYFVTICTHRRRRLFGEVVNGEVVLSELGQLVRNLWDRIPRHQSNVDVDEFVVMPDHFHGVLIIDLQSRGTIYRAPTEERFGGPIPGSIPTIIRTYKAAVTRMWRKSIEDPALRVWQRGYYEHVIRSEDELNGIRRYIQTNPIRWDLRHS
jgi:REP element-mobilizing transposase RayT